MSKKRIMAFVDGYSLCHGIVGLAMGLPGKPETPKHFLKLVNLWNLDKQIAADEQCAKTLRHIEQLGKQAYREIQPRRKWEIEEEARQLKMQMEGLSDG